VIPKSFVTQARRVKSFINKEQPGSNGLRLRSFHPQDDLLQKFIHLRGSSRGSESVCRAIRSSSLASLLHFLHTPPLVSSPAKRFTSMVVITLLINQASTPSTSAD
jgi:hypothetical protein